MKAEGLRPAEIIAVSVASRGLRISTGRLFDHLVGAGEQRRRHVEAKRANGKHCGRPPINPELAERIRKAMAVRGRPGIRVIAKQFGVSPMMVQNVARC